MISETSLLVMALKLLRVYQPDSFKAAIEKLSAETIESIKDFEKKNNSSNEGNERKLF